MNTTKKITINGQTFTARALKRRERREYHLSELGYGPFGYNPTKTPDGEIDWAKSEKGQDLVLNCVFGEKGLEAIDEAGGEVGLREAWLTVITLTYGGEEEEKNSPTSGDGSPTQTESNTAGNA